MAVQPTPTPTVSANLDELLRSASTTGLQYSRLKNAFQVGLKPGQVGYEAPARAVQNDEFTVTAWVAPGLTLKEDLRSGLITSNPVVERTQVSELDEKRSHP